MGARSSASESTQPRGRASPRLTGQSSAGVTFPLDLELSRFGPMLLLCTDMWAVGPGFVGPWKSIAPRKDF